MDRPKRFSLNGMRIRTQILLVLFGLALPLFSLGIFLALEATEDALGRRIEAELNNATVSIVHLVRTAASTSIKNYLRAAAEKNRDIAGHIYSGYESGRLSLEEAKRRIREVLLSQVIGQTGYIYCIDSEGHAAVHPRPAVEGQDQSRFAFVRRQIELKNGYMEYDWQNPEDPSPRAKALYMVYFEPLDWIISVSSYREEFAGLVNVEDFREDVLAYRFGESGYAYIVAVDGEVVVHPHQERFKVLDSGEEANFFAEMRSRGRGRIDYAWQNPGEPRQRPKLVAYETLPEFGWIVASSVYRDEVFAPVRELRRLILAGCVPLAILLFVLAMGIADRLTRPIRSLIDRFQKGAEGDFTVRMHEESSYEFRRLASYFNAFMERLEAYRLDLEAEIRERRRTQSELEESQVHYRILADNLTDVIFLLDMDLNYIFVSPSCRRLQGWSVEEFLTMNISDALTPSALETAIRTLTEELEAGARSGGHPRGRTLEIELLRSDGSTVWAEITASLLTDGEGRPAGVTGVARDITERRAAESEMRELQEKLSRSRKMEALGLLAGGVAHDLNNVLSGIVSYPDLILMDLAEGSPLREPLATIKSSGAKAAAIVQDLLTLARRGVVSTEVLNLNTVVEEVLASPEYAKLASYHPDIETKVSLGSGSPNIQGSDVHLRKSLLNLLSNAMEAQPCGGWVRIRTESRHLDRPVRGYDTVVEGEYAVVAVEDGGEGIAPEEIPRIFEPFYTKKVMGRSGTGLGMAVVWGTVQDHRGYIDVTSRPGTGTAFELYFPTTRDTVAPGNEALPPESYLGHGETVLVVDDVREQREIAAKMLTRLRYNAFTVSSGEKAVDFLRANPVDLVILDMIMDSGMDGLDTFAAIRAFRPGQAFVLASGYAETERVRKAQAAGAGRYLKKPYTLEGLGVAVREALHPGKGSAGPPG